MTGLDFDEVVEKVSERDQGVEGDVTDDKDDEISGSKPFHILDVDSEAEVEPIKSTEHGGFEPSSDEDDAQAHQKGHLPYNMHLTLFFKSMAKSNMDNELHVEKSYRNHILDRSNLIMMGLIFDEVTRRWVKKVSDKDFVGKRVGNNQGESGDEDDVWDWCEPVPILDNDIEPEIEYAKM
ncbi:hypothetical protein Scep_004368 [Stephania cephalantha]|uniref:Uncharacterized protein n=1 Tax=Stephania cephalantha TaxID=152367 RepID=A0AAP0PX89_9MAGN